MIDDSPPIPLNIPPPNSMPRRPAPRKPAASPPNKPMPGRLKKPPPPGVPKPGLPGWAVVRLNGWAAFGAVEVVGGAENVRVPREPELEPPPIRASAADTAMTNGTASDKTTASACTKPKARCLNFMAIFLKNLSLPNSIAGPKGSAPLSGQRRPKGKPQRGGWAAARRRGHQHREPRYPPLRRRHGLLHRRHQLSQREGLWQEGELLVLGQALFESVLRIAGHKDDL